MRQMILALQQTWNVRLRLLSLQDTKINRRHPRCVIEVQGGIRKNHRHRAINVFVVLENPVHDRRADVRTRRVTSEYHSKLAALDTQGASLGVCDSSVRINTLFNGPRVRV